MGRKVSCLLCMTVLVFTLTGCNISTFSIMSSESNTDGRITKKSSYLSGLNIQKIIIKENEDKTINFNIEMEKGSLKLILKDSEGNQVYTLKKDGKSSENDSFTAEKSGTYDLSVETEGFSGSYEITWGNSSENTDDNGFTEEENHVTTSKIMDEIII